MGCVAASRRPPHPHLPNAITLPHRPSKAPYTRPGQFAARLGIEHDPLYVHADVDQPLPSRRPALVAGRRRRRADGSRPAAACCRQIDEARWDFDGAPGDETWSSLQERAWALLASSRTTTAFDVAAEPRPLRERYGQTINGMSLLLARRLVEAGVPFVTVFWKENEAIAGKCKSAGGWDTHGNNFNCLKEHLLPEFDRAFSALIEDLAERGLLDDPAAGHQRDGPDAEDRRLRDPAALGGAGPITGPIA